MALYLGKNKIASGANSNVDIYSTTEVKTNKIWKNGKPIYRKLIETTIIQKDTAHNIPNIDEITDCSTSLKQPSGMYSKQDSSVTFADESIYVIYAQVNGNFTITLEYTKTTD